MYLQIGDEFYEIPDDNVGISCKGCLFNWVEEECGKTNFELDGESFYPCDCFKEELIKEITEPRAILSIKLTGFKKLKLINEITKEDWTLELMNKLKSRRNKCT